MNAGVVLSLRVQPYSPSPSLVFRQTWDENSDFLELKLGVRVKSRVGGRVDYPSALGVMSFRGWDWGQRFVGEERMVNNKESTDKQQGQNNLAGQGRCCGNGIVVT